MAIGLTLVYYFSLGSSRDPFFFVSITLVILTLGFSLIFLDSAVIILLVGFTLIALILAYYDSRQSSRNPLFFLVLALVILTIGAVLTLLSFLGLSTASLGSSLLIAIVLIIIDLNFDIESIIHNKRSRV